jgi:hypothetical protein
MHTKLDDWKNGWLGIELGIAPEEIDPLIAQLKMLKQNHDQHFHISSNYKSQGGIDITIYIQSPDQVSNMERISSRALAPGEDIDLDHSGI